jgi:hypothetical protein
VQTFVYDFQLHRNPTDTIASQSRKGVKSGCPTRSDSITIPDGRLGFVQ